MTIHDEEFWTAELVSERSSYKRPLLMIRGKVYDCTEFVDSHPGGDIILDYQGQDATAAMQDDAIHAHSEATYEIMDDFCIGTMRLNQEDIALSGRVQTKKDRRLAKFIDLEKPIFSQIWSLNLSRDDYIHLIHTPNHLSRVARFFRNPVLEVFSRTPWYVVPILWLPYISWLGYQAWAVHTPITFAYYFIVGLAIWTFAEYSLHRFLFHIDDNLPDNRLAILLHFTFHGVHHFLPMDKMRLVFPPALAMPVLAATWAIFLSLCTYDVTCNLLCGGLLGYVCYDMMHYYVHHGRPAFDYLQQMKTYHMDHHYKDFRKGYGITSKFWDRVFGTKL